MGLNLTKQRPEDEIQYRLRKQNCRMIRSLYKILEAGYKGGYITELEFCMTLSWYHGLKHRILGLEEQVFIQALDKINEFICSVIEERYNAELKNKPQFVDGKTAEVLDPEYFQINPETNKVVKKVPAKVASKATKKIDKKLESYLQILDTSPYRNPK